MTTVEEIMKGPDVVVAVLDDTVEAATKMMSDAEVGSVIIRKNSKVLGIFTERDLVKRVVAKGKDPKVTKLCDVMTSPVKSCKVNDSVVDCAKQFAEGKIRHLAVMEEDALIGVIGLRDVLAMQLEVDQKRIRELEDGAGTTP